MPDTCSACGCRRSEKSKGNGITFHRFPTKPSKRLEWEKAIGRDGFKSSETSVLCSEHFKDEDFNGSGMNVRLKKEVVPSVFPFSSQSTKVVVPLPPRRGSDEPDGFINTAGLGEVIVYESAYTKNTTSDELTFFRRQKLSKVVPFPEEVLNTNDLPMPSFNPQNAQQDVKAFLHDCDTNVQLPVPELVIHKTDTFDRYPPMPVIHDGSCKGDRKRSTNASDSSCKGSRKASTNASDLSCKGSRKGSTNASDLSFKVGSKDPPMPVPHPANDDEGQAHQESLKRKVAEQQLGSTKHKKKSGNERRQDSITGSDPHPFMNEEDVSSTLEELITSNKDVIILNEEDQSNKLELNEEELSKLSLLNKEQLSTLISDEFFEKMY